MSDFVNTIDLLGDDACFKSLVEGTLAGFNDNVEQELVDYSLFKRLSLTSVNFPSVSKIGQYAFANCNYLTTAIFPSVTEIGNYAFRSCWRLTGTIAFPRLISVAIGAFYECRDLENIDMGNAYSIPDSCFTGDYNLLAVVLRKTSVCSLSHTNAFTDTGGGSRPVKIIVHRSLIATYKTATNWSTLYSDGTCTFLALEDYTVDGTTTGEIDWDKVNALA